MIPCNINREHVIKAFNEISKRGVPHRRQSKHFTLVFEGKPFPPKYVISVANKYANGYELDSSSFSGGQESNSFLMCLGFEIIEKTIQGDKVSTKRTELPKCRRLLPKYGHNERCQLCKESIRYLLEHLYGQVHTNYTFQVGTSPEYFSGSTLYRTIQEIYRSLQEFRGHSDFVRTEMLPPVDFYIPKRFIVEFDESQHFTACRKLSLSKYPSHFPTGFRLENWIQLCDQIDARDRTPVYRDEQRAWYDTLRDFIPSIVGLKPTVRLFARHLRWCSLDPNNKRDIDKFERILQGNTEADNPSKQGGFLPAACDSESDTFKVALVVPEVWAPNSSDISSYPQATPRFQPTIPGELDFGGEDIDLVIFPEAYIRSEDNRQLELLRTLSERLKAHLLVGATKRHDGRDADWETLILFDPSGDYRTLYHKHATTGAVAFEIPDWEPEKQLPIFKIRDVNIGCTICHDSYLGLLQRYLAQRGTQIWINPSYDNVIPEKWESIHRLRAVENQIVSLCTLHDNLARRQRRRIRPFGFKPDGAELTGYLVGRQSQARKLSECTTQGIYIAKCPIDSPSAVTNPELLPKTLKQPLLRQRRDDLIRVALIQGLPHVWCGNRWVLLKQGELVDVNGLKLGIGIIPGDKLFDISSFVQLQESIYNLNPDQAKPMFWNQWSELPTEPSRLVNIMMGRTLEMLAPVILSDRHTIYEVTEIAGGTKTMRRISVNSSEAEVDVKFALGLWNSFKITWDKLADIDIPEKYFKPFVKKYLSLI